MGWGYSLREGRMGDGQHEKINVPGKSMGYSSYESIDEEFVFFLLDL